MNNSKSNHVSACCWGYRHELLGLILVVIGTFLTIITLNGLGILMLILVGGLLCCHKHFNWCCGDHSDCSSHCHSTDMHHDVMVVHNDAKSPVKKAPAKPKK